MTFLKQHLVKIGIRGRAPGTPVEDIISELEVRLLQHTSLRFVHCFSAYKIGALANFHIPNLKVSSLIFRGKQEKNTVIVFMLIKIFLTIN